jgi:hypothetical protein
MAVHCDWVFGLPFGVACCRRATVAGPPLPPQPPLPIARPLPFAPPLQGASCSMRCRTLQHLQVVKLAQLQQ